MGEYLLETVEWGVPLDLKVKGKIVQTGLVIELARMPGETFCSA